MSAAAELEKFLVDAELDGFEGFVNGRVAGDNPFTEGSAPHEAWRRGWMTAQHHHRHELT